jgi:hypothetical protein
MGAGAIVHIILSGAEFGNRFYFKPVDEVKN